MLEVELREIAHQLTIERQLSSKLHDQVRPNYNMYAYVCITHA